MSRIIHVFDAFGQTPRHQRAQATWIPLVEDGSIISCPLAAGEYPRDSRSIGDSRKLPFLRDVLKKGLSVANKSDIILWTNDDIGLDPQIVDWCHKDVSRNGAMSMRRNGPVIHIGRDLFAFRSDWLSSRMESWPDFVLAAPAFDLILAALIRKTRGKITTKENLAIDMAECDSTERYAIHEDHPSGWSGENEARFRANFYNISLAKEWCRLNMPSLKL